MSPRRLLRFITVAAAASVVMLDARAEAEQASEAEVRQSARDHLESRAVLGDPERVQLRLGGEYGITWTSQSDLVLSAVPTDRIDSDENLMADNELGQNHYALHWLRFRPELRFLSRFRLVSWIDLLDGFLFF